MLLKQIQYFLAVAECRHFTKAADRLFVSQSALSQQITKLESELGVKLINRLSHPIELTPAGEDFLQGAREVLASVTALQQRMQAWRPRQHHTLRLGLITGLGKLPLMDILSTFNTAHNDIRFSLTTRLSKELCHMLQASELDIAICAAPCDIDNYGFDVVPLQEETFVAILPANHRLAQGKFLDLRDAAQEQFVFPTQENVSHDIFLSACRKAGFTPHIASYCSGPGRRIELVKAGLGISLISESGLHYYQPHTGLTVLPVKPACYKYIVMIRKKGPQDPALQTFWDCLKERI